MTFFRRDNLNLRSLFAWSVRLLLLWAILSAITPQRPRAPVVPPQTVQTVEDHVCVHTRLIDEVEEWVMQRSLQMVREMGADTIVEFFPWAYIEHQPGQYDWRQADRIMRYAENQGIRVIARLGFVPAWARPADQRDSTTLNYLPDDRFDDFAEFAAAFTARYAGTVDHLIIWNEPNLSFEWGYRPVDPAGYVDLLRVTYPAVKAANPDVTVLAGALAPTLEPVGSPNGLDDRLYLTAMYEAGAADYFDALAVHTYGFTEPPESEPAPDVLNFRRAELLFDVMQQYNDDSPVYITESGWNDHPRWTKAVRPSQRVAYTIDAFEYTDMHWPQVEELCVWAFRYPTPTFSYPDNFTLVTVDFQRKPIYYALQSYARGTDDRQRSNDLWLPPPAAD
jgi:hypothetical protein